VDSLPSHEICPVEPFGGFVVNLNVTTTFHRDWKDWDVCGILVISSDCEGGGTVLHEVGLIVEARNGDFMLFPSRRMSHYNAHYKGMRASLVYHTDGAALNWLSDRNGWLDQINFHRGLS